MEDVNGAANVVASGIHILMLPHLAFGHIIPYLQLARKLIATGDNVRVTFLTAAGNVARVAPHLPATPSFSVVPLDLPTVEGLPPNVSSTADISGVEGELLKVAHGLTKPQVEEVLRRARPDVILFDFCLPWLPPVAAALGIKTVLFSIFAATFLAFIGMPSRRLHGPSPTVEDLKLPPAGFPSSSPITSQPTYAADATSYAYVSFYGQSSVFDRFNASVEACDAILVRSCMEMEGPYVNYVASQCVKKVLLAGPITPDPVDGELELRWAEWLDKFPDCAVVFAAFGSENFLGEEGVKELLLGLDMSEFPFLVAINFPRGMQAEDEVRKAMPEGFEERVKGRGLVHFGWLPQHLVLRHRSVGCVLCHAGLSSVVEALSAGHRLAMLPIKGDQFLNTELFVRELGAAVEVSRRDADGWFGRDAVCDAVTEAMVGDGAVRRQQKKWSEFLQDEETQGKFVAELIKNLKVLANIECI